MSIYGCMLGYDLISHQMADQDIRGFIRKNWIMEGGAHHPGVLNPYEFIGTVINRRLPNPFMPSAERIRPKSRHALRRDRPRLTRSIIMTSPNLVLISLVLAGSPAPEGHQRQRRSL